MHPMDLLRIPLWPCVSERIVPPTVYENCCPNTKYSQMIHQFWQIATRVMRSYRPSNSSPPNGPRRCGFRQLQTTHGSFHVKKYVYHLRESRSTPSVKDFTARCILRRSSRLIRRINARCHCCRNRLRLWPSRWLWTMMMTALRMETISRHAKLLVMIR